MNYVGHISGSHSIPILFFILLYFLNFFETGSHFVALAGVRGVIITHCGLEQLCSNNLVNSAS